MLAPAPHTVQKSAITAYFHLKFGDDRHYSFTLRASNHAVLLTSPRHASRHAALDGIECMRVNLALPERFIRKATKDDRQYFVLVAANGQVVGVSQTYSTPRAMEIGIHAARTQGMVTLVKES